MVLYTVLLDVDNSDQALMAEMTAQIFFVAGKAENTLTAPLAALQNSAQADVQTAQVLAANGEVQNRQVRTGISDRLRVQVIDGLSEGDRLLVPARHPQILRRWRQPAGQRAARHRPVDSCRRVRGDCRRVRLR
ncbi:RND family efflux transporter MFP subunit [Pseudomonas syringae pv. actinidiae ICMP 19096]|uniref:RND family efflux transporter MFP subunit n=1 Tax=Pseudomonas syringae pv. actinidiae ICMP 19096 TaxID=1194405 RepID=A0A656JW00_PSESF|nr:RND family efflux transporter MFP subunit [Pseudomonas syringae pv. actinidiae ICMP 19096]